MKKIRMYSFIFSMFILFSCQNNKQDKNSLSDKKENTDSVAKDKTSFSYDLKNPTHSWVLPSELVEVSGNTWIDKNNLILI